MALDSPRKPAVLFTTAPDGVDTMEPIEALNALSVFIERRYSLPPRAVSSVPMSVTSKK